MQSEITLCDRIEECGFQFEWRMKLTKGSAEIPIGVSPTLIENIFTNIASDIKSYFTELKKPVEEAID